MRLINHFKNKGGIIAWVEGQGMSSYRGEPQKAWIKEDRSEMWLLEAGEDYPEPKEGYAKAGVFFK